MNFLIKNTFGIHIGTIPASNILSGSSDVGDVTNSWVTFTLSGITKFPQHPLSVFNTIASHVVLTNLGSADGFEAQVSDSDVDSHYDDIITFKGQQYYVVDYTPADHARTEALLEIVEKSHFDKRMAALNTKVTDETIKENLDVLWAAIQGQWTSAPLPQLVTNSAPVLAKPLPVTGTAGPARSVAPTPTAVAAPARQQLPIARGKANTFKSSQGVDLDVAAAQGALAALLQKGSL